MGAIEGRLKEARREVLLAAATRWREREAPRRQNLSNIARSGVGAGDTPKRQQEWFARERAKAQNKMLFVERVIGPSADFSPFAPSQLATKAAQPVARIVTLPGDGRVPQGMATGFLIPGNLLLTNFHVFQTRSDANGYGANFNYYEDERGLNEGSYFELDPHSFFIADKDFDFAIVAVKPKGLRGESLAAMGQILLIEATGKILTGAALNIVQHPNGGPRQFAFTNNRLLDILATGFLHYETDTDKGSSGSPVCNIDWELVGLHHCGVPKVENGNILTINNTVWDDNHQPESDIQWVANECARVSSIVGRLRALTADTPAEQAMLSTLLTTTSDPVATPAVAVENVTLSAIGGNMSSPVFSFSGPVTINVYPPATASPLPAALAPVPAPTFSAEEKSLVFDSVYAKRPGYDPLFLDIEIPLPAIDPSRHDELYSVADYQAYYEDYRNVPRMALGDSTPDEPLILPYHHYSLAFNKQYRMCHWTASNCDYREVERMDTRKRADLGGENWRYDPRVPEQLQLGNADVYGPAKRLDRGHIVRREDNAWGAAGLPTDYANADTYHWTNCTPQHEAFNQENPKDNRPGSSIYKDKGVKGIWGEFEGDLAGAVEKGGGQVTIFAGPLLYEHFAETDWGKGKVAIPKKFWKVYVVPESSAKPTRLQVYGYIFSQEPAVKAYGMTYEGVDLPKFERNRATLDQISEVTGIIFPNILKEAELP
jgi:endonuclease G